MSLKNSKTEKKKPRAMPVETIVTRFKSAQQKQQLEKELRSTRKSKIIKPTKITQVNTKPSERKSPRRRKIQNLNKKPEKYDKEAIDEKKVENKEYYPNKLKRKVLNARIFLAPKHSFKIICGTKSCNKRKLHVPQRDIKYIKEQKPQVTESPSPSPELTITEMVRIMEQDGSLDDEDLLEILTCPSPVWWEEPPDGYFEEPIVTQPRPKEKQQSIKEQIEEEKKIEQKIQEESSNNENINKINLQDSIDISIDTKDTNFINKRSHLETLLGNIKNKVTRPIEKVNSHKNVSKTSNSMKDVKIDDNKNNSKVKSNSECTEEDLVEFRDDEILKHLENIDIPIEENLKKEEDDKDHLNTRRVSIDSNKSDKNMTEEYLDLSLLDEDEKCLDLKNDSNEIDESISTLNISSHSEAKSNESEEILNISSDIEQSVNEIDEINEIQSDSNDKNIDTSKKNEYVTVYKILCNDSAKDLQEDIKRIYKRKELKDSKEKIDSYYKKCKKISTLKTLNNENEVKNQENNENKSITISEADNVKYCFICSSIFDTDSCNYCLRKNLKRKFDENSEKCGSDVGYSSEND